MNQKNYIVLLLLYVCFSYLVFISFINDNYYESSTYKLDADAGTYYDLSKYGDLTIKEMVIFEQNLIGPALILWLTNYDNTSVFIVNIVLFAIACRLMLVNFKTEINKLHFVALIVVNPMILASLLTVNKEIIGLFSIALFACYLKSKKLPYLLLFILFAFLTRWHELIVLLCFFLLSSRINPFKENRLKTCIIFALFLSVVYPFLANHVSLEQFVVKEQFDKAFGIMAIFNWLQNNYLFFVALVPKMLSNLFGNVFRIWSVLIGSDSVDYKDLYTWYIILGHQIVIFIMFIKLFISKKITLKNDFIYFSVIYLIVFSLNPAIQYRYIFPLYILFCLELSRVPVLFQQDQKLVYV